MFAVPGWAVPPSSLVKERVNLKIHKQNNVGTPTSKQSRKRKRDPLRTNPVLESSEGGRVGKDENYNSFDGKTLDAIKRRKQVGRSDKKPKHNVYQKPTKPLNRISKHISTSDVKPDHNLLREKRTEGDTQSFQQRPLHANNDDSAKEFVTNLSPPTTLQAPTPSASGLTALQAKMRSKLASARFRHLNETLYTTTSDEALSLFTSSPDLFNEYHTGFAQQVRDSWPQNPVDDYIKSVRIRGAVTETKHQHMPLPRRKTGSCTIADLGCGDAPLARGCQSVVRTLHLKFHNYDLHQANSLVTKADISNVPLRDGEADIAVFCLSLMGTNWISFVEEAWRILRGDGKGEVWVAEVKSRFGRTTKGRVVENSVGKRRKRLISRKNDDDREYDDLERFVEDERTQVELDNETDISAFIKVFTRRGFQLSTGSVNKQNKMFVSMMFTKTGIPTAGKYKGLKWTGKAYQKQQDSKMRFLGGQKDDEDISPDQEAKVLKPCVYKTR